MKKKLVSMLLVVAMLLSLCACAGPADDKTTVAPSDKTTVAPNDEQTTEDGTEAPVDESVYPIVKEGDEPITIKVAVAKPDTTVSEERLVWQALEEVTGINIEYDFVDLDALTTYLAQDGDDWPDVFHINLGASIVNDYGIYGGRFVNYLDKLDIMPNLAKTFEDYPSARRVVTLSNGEAYNTPYVAKAVTDITPRLFYRADYLEQIGMEAPKTIEEFKAILVKGKEVFGKPQYVYPSTSGLGTGGEYTLFSAFGPDNDMLWNADENGKVSFARTTEQCKLFYKFMNELYEEELIHKEYKTLDYAAAVAHEKQNCIFVYHAAEYLTTEDFADGQFHLGGVGALSSEYDNTLDLVGRLGVSNAGGFYINAKSEYVDEICKMVDIAYATEEVVEGSGLYGISFTYGLENKHWKFSGDSYEFLTPASYNGANNKFVSQEIRYMNAGRYDAFQGMVTLTPGNGQARQTAFAEDIWPYIEEEASIFPTNQLTHTEDEQEIIDQYWTEIDTYMKQMETEFIQGISDIDAKWDEYVANLKAMHLDEVVAAKQAAYDRWMAN